MPSIVFTEPEMSLNDNSDDSIRKLTDDYGRHKLTDLVEADENEEDGLECLRSSSRRKRYSSNSSAVLTEDTDSFIIGQRVWVGGTKPGTIAYIGETQFAPGDWAGIALDEPIGKNDGSVAGIRYFQCENKKGVFSRLTRLTRVPLDQPGMGSTDTFTPPNNGVRRSPISPTGSSRSLIKSPTLSNSNTSLSLANVDFKIGDRVIIKSTQGSKVGTVRYMGLTDFAPGEWVGVELDDPRGKNDGSVEGKRYFECRPNFGLFAPIHKVSKSPSKHKPGACVIHSGASLPPSGLKRTNSKESMNSVASKTSAASSVRRDVLREKQQHIEQLLKERDLERAEITRAASQADEAEHRFFSLKQEFEQYRIECEAKVQENSLLLSQLKVDRQELLSQLEDEKRKNEDLQFRFEEAAITKTDIEADILAQSATNESNVRKIRELEKTLAEERAKAENAEGISNKLFEAEESLIKAREECDNLRIELEETKKKREVIEEERTKSAELISSLQKRLDEVVVEKEGKDKELNENILKVNSEHEVVMQQVQENFQKKDAEIEALQNKLARSEELLKEKSKMIENFGKQFAELTKENDKLKMDISAKSHDLETTVEQLSAKEHEIKFLEEKIEDERSQLNQKISDLERLKDNSSDVQVSLQKELEETRENLKLTLSEIEDVKKELNIQLVQKDTKLEEINKMAAQNNEIIEKLHTEVADAKNKFEKSKKEIENRHAEQLADQESQLKTLSTEIQQKNEEITKSSIIISKLEEDIRAKNDNVERLRIELESYKTQHASHMESSSIMAQKLHDLELNNGDLQRKLDAAVEQVSALTEAKQRLEMEIQTITVTSGQENASQLEQLRKEIQEKERVIEINRLETTDKIQASERIRQELELKYQQLAADSAQLREQFEQKLHVSSQSEALLKERYDASVAEISKIREEYTFKIGELEKSLQEKEQLLVSLEKKFSENENRYQEQLKTNAEELSRVQQSGQENIATLTQEIELLKEQLAKKSEETVELNAKVDRLVAESQQSENEIKQKYTENVKKIEFELNEKTVQLETTLKELTILKNDYQSSNSDLIAKNQKIDELNVEVEKAKGVINSLEAELNTLREAQQLANKEYEQTQSQCKGLAEQVGILTEKVSIGEQSFKTLQLDYENVMQLVKRLKLTEEQKQQCLKELQNEVNNSEVINLLNLIKIENNNKVTETIKALQQEIDFSKNKISEYNQQFEKQRREILRLQDDLLKAQEATAKRNGEQGDQNSLLQDKELAENQIKFLNSIIVDIQQKNEEQKARIAILESGYSPAMADELKEIGLPDHRQLPPRVYCDICEEFDSHETEDCPLQNSDVAPAHSSRGTKIAEERPYCEICEMFGHTTEECQDDQTF